MMQEELFVRESPQPHSAPPPKSQRSSSARVARRGGADGASGASCRSLNILHIEDQDDDVVLVRGLLEEAGIKCRIQVVDSREGFLAALEKGPVDLILADHSLPEFDSLSALEIVSESWSHIPFIIVSGTVCEERAVSALKKGASDYILKDRPARLVPAVRRALRELEEHADRRKLEQQFIEAQKMEVMGRLVGGVAHDFNNILSVILGYSESAISSLDTKHPLRPDLEETRLAAERGAALVRQLLNFSSRQVAQPEVIDLNERTEELRNMLQKLIGENVAMTISFDCKDARIEADPCQIGQVLMNMVVNARDAMPRGGRIRIATSAVECDSERACAGGLLAPGSYVVLSVRDSGVGMTDEVKEHIFEAFFTTKAKGIGTGLGLATCRTIVFQCGGCIDVASELGRGTTFDIYFPRVAEAAIPDVEPPATAVPSGTETVLLVEDDPALRRLAHRTLQQLGYTVLCAANGDEGVRMAREHRGAPVRLVVTDVVMPQMGGREMAEVLRRDFPEMNFLFTSGYSGSVLARHGALESGMAILSKPYTPSLLARRIREMIDGQTSGQAERTGSSSESATA